MPNAVATPLPPLNFMYGVSMWPTTQATPTQSAASGRKRRAARVGRRPLRTSHAKATSPHFLPTVRNTFVAPMFFEPTVRTSTPRILPMRYPNGIPPTRYAPRIHAAHTIVFSSMAVLYQKPPRYFAAS